MRTLPTTRDSADPVVDPVAVLLAQQMAASPSVQAALFRRNLSRVVAQAGQLHSFAPDRVVEVLDAQGWGILDTACREIADWHASIAKRRRGLRVAP